MIPLILKEVKNQIPRKARITFLAGTIGFLLNIFPIELFYKVWILFGSIPTLIITLTLGPQWGTLTAMIASSYILFLWGSLHGILLYLLYGLEALILGSLIRERFPVLVDTFYWVLIGSPLLYWTDTLWLNYSKTYASTLGIGLIWNGFLNIAIAQLLLLLVPPINRFLSESERRRSESLQSYLLVAFILIAVTPVVIISLVNSRSQIKKELEERKNNLRELSHSLSAGIGGYVKFHTERFQTLVRQLEARRDFQPSGELRTLITSFYKESEGFSAFYLADGSGRIQTMDPSPGILQEIHFNDQEYHKKLIQKKTSMVSEAFFMRGSEPMMVLAHPILDDRGEIKAVIGGFLNLRVITDLIDPFKTDKEREILVIDEHNQVISSNDPKRYRTLEDLSKTKPLAQIFTGDSGISQYYREDLEKRTSPESTIRLVGFQVIDPLGWKVLIEQSLAGIYPEIQNIYKQLAQRILVISGISVLIGIFLSRAISYPVRKLEKATRVFTENLRIRPILGGNRGNIFSEDIVAPTELALLTKTFSRMAEEIEGSYSRLELMVKKRTEELEEKNLQLERMNKQLEEKNLQLEQMNRKLQEFNRLKAAFLANLSHELRSPLDSILSLSEALARKIPGELKPELGEYVKIIYNSGKDLLEMINDLLDISKVEAGKMKINYRPFVVNRLIDEVVEIISLQAEKKGLRFLVEVAEGTPLVIYSDEEKVRRVLLNLLSNAIKFTKEGLIVLSVKTLTPEDPPKPFIQFSVSDTGIGISRENLEIIFEEFSQVDPASVRRFQGTGLGLAISKKLVQMLDGEIRAHSELKEGSTFTFQIPTHEDRIDPDVLSFILEGEKKAKILYGKFELKPTTRNGPKILLVEDNRSIQYLVKVALVEAGFDLVIADDGQDGIRKASKIKPNLILMDLTLPLVAGETAIKTLREMEEFKETPIIGMISEVTEEVRDKILQAGGNDYLIKPVQEADLIKKVQDWLNKVPDSPSSQNPISKGGI
ncbi:MAG TPA: ATP-binding protein [Candidatus Limnocylindrales bacterium]|nr:ATP-binding protein [Candidatus Limnocylindrales bacterium]